MAQQVQITCVVKTDRTNPHERIHSVGGVNSDGTRWKLSEDNAIAYIEKGTYSFYVERPFGHRVDVIIATSQWGHKYLKTFADGEHPNNLLSLSTCP
jgi:Protein of unknown function (DUF3892)